MGESQDTAKPRALLFELENLATDGRGVAYKTMEAALKRRSLKLSPYQYSRYCLGRFSGRSASRLLRALDVSDGDVATLEKTLAEKIQKAIIDSAKLNADLDALLTKMTAQDVKVGALSALPAQGAEALAAKLGLPERGVLIQSGPLENGAYPTTDAWIRLSRSVGVSPVRCVALGSHQVSCRSAIAAGMRFVALPDSFTSFQDFGGADRSLDEFAAEPIEALLA